MIASASECDPSISVVIPCYDRVEFLRKALDSVQSQTLKAKQILVVDDGSPNPLAKSLEHEFPYVEWIYQEQAGVSSARNHGIRLAKYPWIALLDSDDQWKPNKLELQWAFHKENPLIKFSHTGETWIRNGNRVNAPKYLDKSKHLFFERSLDRCLICPSSVLIHRTLLTKLGGFDESFPVCEDYDLWIRLLASYEIGFLAEELVIKFGGHADQLSTQTWGMDRFRIRSLENLLLSDLDKDKEIKVLSVIIKKCEILINGFQKRGKFKDAENFMSKKQTYQNRIDRIKIVETA